MNILKAWARLNYESIEPILTGLINQTYLVKTQTGSYILQKLHSVFAPEVNKNILAVTDYLASQNFLTPRLIKTDSGELWVLEEDNSCWRLLSFIEGQSFDQLTSSEAAYSAGQLVGQFHKTLFDFKYDYAAVRKNVHDTPGYLKRLAENLKQHTKHAFFKRVEPIATQLIQQASQIPNLWNLPNRHSHGDLKISNLLFEGEKAICLIDLDTLGKMPWPIEMGDAFRSWCNLKGENQSQSNFDLNIYHAALQGYQEQVWDCWSEPEREALLDGIRLIPLELCARFLNDIFDDSYFSWDIKRFKSRAEHNWVRAMGQWSLYEDILRKL
ncbi:MAG: phosphotransferase [Myxococcaceae bacterium]